MTFCIVGLEPNTIAKSVPQFGIFPGRFCIALMRGVFVSRFPVNNQAVLLVFTLVPGWPASRVLGRAQFSYLERTYVLGR